MLVQEIKSEQRKRMLALAGVLAALALLMLWSTLAQSVYAQKAEPSAAVRSSLLVTSPADSGPGTLRQALLDSDTGDTITFDSAVFLPDNPVTIDLMSILPYIITDGLTIDASNAGVILDGNAIVDGGWGQSGLVIDGASACAIRGLQVVNFPYYGVEIWGGEYNEIGGDRSVGVGPMGQGNLISGNCYGLEIAGSTAMSNTVIGNFIGTDLDGAAAVGGRCGGTNGMQVGADHNQIGSTQPGVRNIVAGYIWLAPPYTAPANNRIVGNYVGLDVSGTTCIGSGWSGIAVWGSDNVIGGDTPAGGNRVCGYDHHGISINGSDNYVAYNEVYRNGEDGIRVSGVTAISNTLTHNSVYDNGGLGINLVDGGNTELPAPVILAYDLDDGTASGTACANCTVELFSDEHGEGHWFEASTTASGAGSWSISTGGPFTGPELTATATDFAGNTSEFGQDWPPDPPAPPFIGFPVCGVTNQPAPLFVGHAQAASIVRVGAEGLALGETTTDDRNRWNLPSEEALLDGAYVVTATASTAWGTSDEAMLDLTVDSDLCFDPVGVTFAQLDITQHPRNAVGCVDPADDLEIDLWPDKPVTVKVPARVATATVYIEVNSIPYNLYDPDGDKVFTGSFTPPSSGSVVILVVAECDPSPDTMQIGSLIDPDGYVYDAFLTAQTGVTQTVEGVTVTLYLSDTVRHKWLVWDAELYEQINPQVTGPEGYFSFFTPPGGFKLVADGQAEGYELYESPLLTVVDEPIRYNVPLWIPLDRIYLPMVLRQH